MSGGAPLRLRLGARRPTTRPPGGLPRRWAAAWLVLVVGTTLSVAAGIALRSDVQQQSQNAFNAEASDVSGAIASSLARMNDLTVTMRTLVATHPDLTNRDWTRWYASLDVGQRYPSALSFGYGQIVPSAQLPAFVRTMHADPRPGQDPRTPFVIVPPGKRPYYCLVRLGRLSGPLASLPEGMDVCALSKGSFLERPRDTGQLSVTTITMENKPLAEITAAVYRGGGVPNTLAGRRAAIIGIIGGVFDVRQMLSAALRSHPSLSATLVRRDYEQDHEQPEEYQWIERLVNRRADAMVGTVGPTQPASALRHDVAVSADGEWVIQVSGPPRAGGWSATAQGAAVLAGGLLVTLLLFCLVSVLTRGRQRALDLVARRTAELTGSEERFRSLAASSPVGILQTDDTGHLQYANDRLCSILGRDPDQLTGNGWLEAIVPDDREKVSQALQTADGAACAVEARIFPDHDPAEELRWVRFTTAALTAGEGPTGRVSSVEDITAEILDRDRLTREARHDALTGLPNRVHFLERLAHTLHTMRGTDTQVGVLFIDLDRFKQVNDTHGHAAGDELLAATARRITAALRPGDLLARLGGDEFAVLLDHVDDVAEAVAIVDRLQAAVERPFRISAGEVFIGASVGLALVDDPDGDPAAILQGADVAMYRAKSGATGFEIYDLDMPA
jgi:diguanylate cyclase (GGDEF)-like protein/PAS domain S-box-containing protein